MIGPGDVERIFRDARAFAEGHFVLASGKHSSVYLEKFQVLQWPRETERLCETIAALWRSAVPDTVAGPTTGGVILAHEVARQLGTRAVYAERREDGPGRVFRRGFQLAPGEHVLVVDDILTTGGSLQDTISAVTAAGAKVIGAAVLVDRSAGKVTLDVPIHALWSLDIPAYVPEACPLCAQGVPFTKPGTTPAQKTHA